MPRFRSVPRAPAPMSTAAVALGVTTLALGAYYATRQPLPSGRQFERVVGIATITDGDTIHVQGRKIRLIGIDAPEMNQSCDGSQGNFGCGAEARRHLVQLVGALPVLCEGSLTDRYKRLLAVCTAGGRDLNAAMVRDGWAVSYRGAYRAEEKDARARFEGLWGGNFVLPQEWRKSTRGDAAEAGDIDADGLDYPE